MERRHRFCGIFRRKAPFRQCSTAFLFRHRRHRQRHDTGTHRRQQRCRRSCRKNKIPISRRFFHRFQQQILGAGVHCITVPKDIALGIALVGRRCQIYTHLPHRVHGKAVSLAAVFHKPHVRMHTVRQHFAGFAAAAGLFRSCAEQFCQELLCQRLFPQTGFPVKEESVGSPVPQKHLVQGVLYLFIAIKLCHAATSYCTTLISVIP